MRNTLIGIALSAVFIGALFWASQRGSQTAVREAVPAAPTPDQALAGIKDGFVGTRKIGDWQLVCGPDSGKGQGATPPRGPASHAAVPRCQVAMGLRKANAQSEEVRVTFRLTGPRRALTVFVRIPPDETKNGDTAQLQLDGAALNVPVRACSADFCLGIAPVRIDDAAKLASSRRMSVVFTPTGSRQARVISLSTFGLSQALAAQKRLDG